MLDDALARGTLHQGGIIRRAGEPLETARAAVLMLHGRGASAEDILTLAERLGEPGFAYLAPQAANHTWYPNRFLAPLESNEPWLSSALERVGEVLATIRAAGIPDKRVMLLGFSQGACLTLEFAARHARRYGGVVGLTGALIGPEDALRDYAGSFSGTPVFLGCSDVDIHVAKDRVEETARVFRRLGAEVTERYYPGLDHSVNEDEFSFVRGMMHGVLLPSDHL
jgi:phospholipase/carboxylesterase